MAKRVKIPGRLESAETGNIVAGADAVMDDEKGKTQVVINSEVDAAIINLAQGKQDNLTFDNAPTEDSPNPVTSGGVYTADKVLSDAIEAILLLIPSAASALNKLVDMQTMNSSIATATASFKGTYNLVSDLHLGVDATHEQIGAALDALSLGADNNDYAFVQVPNSATAPTEISKTERYKYNGTNWLYEYDLNNSGFTSPQWNAINSGVTSLLVGKLSDLPTNAELTTLLAGKQDNLTFDNMPTAGSPNPVKSGGVYARNNEIVALINALDAAKQDVLTFDNAPVSGSPNPVKSGGVYTAISAVQAAVVALDAAKQNVLTFDSTPTLGSTNPVTSSGIKTELNRIDGNITTLNDLYEALTQSALVIVQPTDTWPVASPATSTIYRVIDRVNTPPQNYSDYMWNGSTMELMATYDNAIDDVPTVGSNNLVKSGGVYKSLSKGVLIQKGVTSAVWFDINVLKGRRVKLEVKNSISDAALSLYNTGGGSSVFYVILRTNVEFYMDFTGLTDSDSINLYYSLSTDSSLFWEELEEDEFSPIVYNPDWTTIPDNSYYTTDFKTIAYKVNSQSAQRVFPNVQNTYHVASPTGKEIFTINGEKYVWKNDTFEKIVTVNDIQRDRIVTKILSRYGHIDTDGTLSGLDNPSTDCFVTDNLIPVRQGDIVLYLGGYFTGQFYPLWGYSDDKFGTPVKLGDNEFNRQVMAFSCVVNNPNVQYVGCFGKTDFNPAIAVIPKELITRDYDFYVAADGSGDCESLFHVLQLTKALDSERHINIFVKSGMYNMIDGNNANVFATARNISVIGEDKNSVIIYNNNGEYTEINVDNTPIRLSGNVALTNLTIISRSIDYTGEGTPAAYCVHVDFNTNGQESVVEIENCRMLNDHYACIGAGLRDNFTLRIKGCELRSVSAESFISQNWNGAVICHDGNQEGVNQNIELFRNILECTGDRAVSLSAAYQKQINATFVGNAIFSATDTPVYMGPTTVLNRRSCLNNVSEVNYQQ